VKLQRLAPYTFPPYVSAPLKPSRGSTPRTAIAQREGGQLGLKTRMLGATYLKLVNPLVLGTTLGGSVFNPLTWPLTLAGMAGSYTGGLAAEALSKGLLKDAKRLRTLTPEQQRFFRQPGNEIMLELLSADYSGLMLDDNTYKSLHYQTKYHHLLRQMNRLGAHFLGLHRVGGFMPKLWKQDGSTGVRTPSVFAEKAMQQYAIQAQKLKHTAGNETTTKATRPMMNLLFDDEPMPFSAKALNALTHVQAVRWFTTTPIMALLPNRDKGVQAGSWLHEIPIVGAALGEKVPKMGRVRALYFHTSTAGNLEHMRVKHWKRFENHVERSNALLAAAKVKAPPLTLDEAHFKEFLQAVSQHEKKMAVRLGLYHLVFNLHEEEESMGGFIKRWHDMDGAGMRSMFDVAQSLKPVKGLQYLGHNALNEAWLRVSTGGFSALMSFGTSYLPGPLRNVGNVLAQAFAFSFDIQRKPIKLGKYHDYNGLNKR
jgi:hypothetical protein